MPSFVRGELSSKLQRLANAAPELDRNIHKAVGSRWLVLVKQLTPVSDIDPDDPHHRPGRLRRSWKVRRSGQHTVIYTRVPYAKFVEYDTAPHVITPKKAKALRFRVDGHLVFAARVMHPGTTGAFMLTKSTAQVQRELPRIGEREIRKWVRKHGW